MMSRNPVFYRVVDRQISAIAKERGQDTEEVKKRLLERIRDEHEKATSGDGHDGK